MVTTEQIKELRETTGISIAECKKALEAADGNMVKAQEALKARGADIVAKKSDRTLAAGVVTAYIHGGNIGALVEVHAETDFVAKNEGFRSLADDIAMQVAAMNPADLDELLTQPFIKDPSTSIGDLVKNAVQKFGERVEVARFTRFSTGAH